MYYYCQWICSLITKEINCMFTHILEKALKFSWPVGYHTHLHNITCILDVVLSCFFY